jgi:hypothetical protein
MQFLLGTVTPVETFLGIFSEFFFSPRKQDFGTGFNKFSPLLLQTTKKHQHEKENLLPYLSWNQIWRDPPVDDCHFGYIPPPPPQKKKQTNKQKQNQTKQNMLPMDDCQFGYKNKFL